MRYISFITQGKKISFSSCIASIYIVFHLLAKVFFVYVSLFYGTISAVISDSWANYIFITFQAVRRIMERNKLSKEEATRRIESQLSNQARVNQANVIICTLWEYEVTQKQVRS